MIRVMRRLMVRRRIRKILASVGITGERQRVFTGNVSIEETPYDETKRFADFWVNEWKDPS